MICGQPPEIWTLIISYLPIRDIVAVSRACRLFRNIVFDPKNDSVIWKRHASAMRLYVHLPPEYHLRVCDSTVWRHIAHYSTPPRPTSLEKVKAMTPFFIDKTKKEHEKKWYMKTFFPDASVAGVTVVMLFSMWLLFLADDSEVFTLRHLVDAENAVLEAETFSLAAIRSCYSVYSLCMFMSYPLKVVSEKAFYTSMKIACYAANDYDKCLDELDHYYITAVGIVLFYISALFVIYLRKRILQSVVNKTMALL